MVSFLDRDSLSNSLLLFGEESEDISSSLIIFEDNSISKLMAPPNASLQPRQCSDDSLLIITPDDDCSMYESNSHRSPSFTTSTPKGTQTSNMRRIHCEECDSEGLFSSSKRACLDDSLYLYYEDTNQSASTLELVSNQCCRNDCLKSLPENIIEQALLKFAARTISEQNQFLLTCFELSIGNSKKMTHVLEGHSLCNNAFKHIYYASLTKDISKFIKNTGKE